MEYFSRYPEIANLTTTMSSVVISKLNDVLSQHEIPEIVRSDNGLQFSAQEFAEFANTYGFRYVTSSPKYPQSNGQIERVVQTMKNLLKNTEDRHLAVLSYHATPHPWCKLSPAELSMGQHIRTMVPVTDDHLLPNWLYHPRYQKINSQFKEKQNKDFDCYHGIYSLSPISMIQMCGLTLMMEDKCQGKLCQLLNLHNLM